MKLYDLAIAGELNLDLILYGLPAEMALERELVATSFRATLGSSSAIVAHNAAALGCRVSFSGIVGRDEFGASAFRRLAASGVDTSHVEERAGLSTGVTVLLPHGAERHILTYPGTIAAMTPRDLDPGFLAQARHFHFSSLYLQKGLAEGLPELFRALKLAGLTISLDTNDDPDDAWGAPFREVLPYVDVLLPNEAELCRLAGGLGLTQALEHLARDVATIVVKRGSRGALVCERGRTVEIAPVRVDPVDTIGAGDSFDAGFLRAFLAGKELTVCAQAGNIAGALSTQASGGTEAFLDAALREEFLQRHGYFELLERGAARG